MMIRPSIGRRTRPAAERADGSALLPSSALCAALAMCPGSGPERFRSTLSLRSAELGGTQNRESG
jgi:hypothetical protein